MLYTGNPTDNKTDGIPVSENGVMSSPISASVAVGSEAVVLCAARAPESRTITITGGANILLSADDTVYGSTLTLTIGAVNTLFYVKLTTESTDVPGTHGSSITVTYTEDSETITRQYDVQCIIPFANIPVESVQLSLNAKTLSDSFRASTVKSLVPSLKLDDSIVGSLLDYHYNFVVDELSQNGGRVSIEGRYSSDKLLFSLIKLELPNSARLGYHDGKAVFKVSGYFNALATALWLTPRFYCRDWAVKPGTVNNSCTYQQALQALFGWFDLAHIDVNVFIRGNNLFCVERGYESSVIAAGLGQNVSITDAANAKFEPTVTTHRIRTEWQGGTESASPIKSNDITDDSPTPFTGTITFGDNSLTYQDGYLMTETTPSGTAGTSNVTNYTYTTIGGKKYLSVKEFFDYVNATCNKTVYSYVNHNGVLYLSKETNYANGQHTSGQNPDYSGADITITEHVPIGNGWYGTTVRDATTGDTTTSLGQGGPANAVTQYMIDKAQEALDDLTSTITDLRDRILASLFGTPIVNTNYPIDSVYGLTDIRYLADQTDWLNNRFEETVNVDIVNMSHVIDFTDLISYRGNTYVLQSNTISQTPAGINQNVTLIRWHA